eukprot:1160393-Pelagomonas_calceolata.AAC.23
MGFLELRSIQHGKAFEEEGFCNGKENCKGAQWLTMAIFECSRSSHDLIEKSGKWLAVPTFEGNLGFFSLFRVPEDIAMSHKGLCKEESRHQEKKSKES